MSCDPLALETVWLDKYKYEDAERIFHERSYKLQWMKSSSKMSETKVESKEEVQPIKDAVKEEPLPLPMDKGEKIEAVAPLLEEVKKPAKEKKKDDKAPKKEGEKKDDVTEKEEKNGAAKKKNKEDDVKEKQAKKKKPDAKKAKDEKVDEKKDNVSVVAATNDSLVDSAVKIENQIDVTSKEESPSKDEGKKGNKKTKNKKNKKNEQAVDGKQESSEGKKESNETVKESSSKKADKKELAAEQHKKKADKKESKKVNPHCSSAGKSSLADEIARARQQIKNSLNCDSGVSVNDSANLLPRIKKLEDENKRLRNMAEDVKKMTQFMSKLVARVDELENSIKSSKGCVISSPTTKTEKTEVKSKKDVNEDDIDLFGSDEDEEKEKLKAERLRLYEEKKAKKPFLVAKSNIILDVKPWDDETDMKAMEVKVREVACDGLLWGASKLVPLAFGIHKLQVSCVIEDEKVSVDWLQEQIEANEDLVQSVDIAAFNKV